MARESGVEAFGEQLRRERESRGVGVDAMCNATKMSSRQVAALETGALGELPGGVFRRGFLRSYLAVLELEREPWMQRFEESCRQSGFSDPADVEWVTFAENVKNGRGQKRRRGRWRWLGGVAILLVLGVAGWCGWRLATHRSVLHAAPVWRRVKSWVDNAPSR